MSGNLGLKARDPRDLNGWLPVEIDSEFAQYLAGAGRRTDLLQMLYLLAGVLPDVNNIGYHERDEEVASIYVGLPSAHAIFRGIKRPCIEDGFDDQVLVYVLAPAFTYQYAPGMVCAFRRLSAPEGSIYVVYVKISEDGKAVVLNTEWVKAESGGKLPAGYESRYMERIWNA